MKIIIHSLLVPLLTIIAMCKGFPYEESTKSLEDDFYALCATDHSNCIGAVSKSENEHFYDCIDNKNCVTAVAFSKGSKSYIFHTMTVNKTYVAMGFADQQGMGSDAVVQCIEEDDGVIGVYLSYNYDNDGEPANKRIDSRDGLNVLETKKENLTLYCKFEVMQGTNFGPRDFLTGKSQNESYYLIAVSGNAAHDENGKVVGVGHHSGHVYTPEKINFMWSNGSTILSSIVLITACVIFTQR